MSPRFAIFAILALGGCSATQNRIISPGEQQARSIEARYTQTARLDPHTEVQVTQWNNQLRHAERLRAQGKSKLEQETVDARVRRWDEKAKGKESYMVLIEVRDADAARKDPRLDLSRWSFALRSSGGSQLRKAEQVELLSKDRFSAESGGAHWRIGARVDFPASTRPSSVTLEVWAPDEAPPAHALRAKLPQLPARFRFPAQTPKPAPRPKAALTPIQPTR